MFTRLFALVAAAACALPAAAQSPTFTRTEDVIYGRKYGTALTLDVFEPKAKKNGAAVVMVISGGWYSAHDNINVGFFAEVLKRGYTVFAVVHGSQPRFTIPEAVEDMHRAVRFVRANAKKYEFDPDRIGITGASAGGHLSLMQGTAFKPGDPKAKDPVERASSKANAVGCFFPPTDFLNYGQDGAAAGVGGSEDTLKGFRAPFDFQEIDPRGGFRPVADPDKRKAILKAVSPAQQAGKGSAPSLIIHGDADKLVPIQQAERIIAKFKEHDVPCELVVKKGAAHGWAGLEKDCVTIADWFDKHLPAKQP